MWANHLATVDSELVARYRRAGMVVLGMTNSAELGWNASTEPLLHGPTRNPWQITHSPGGSSGESASAVAAGMVPVAHGSDGGGSIRIPAAMCGLFGLKPSRGRVTTYPEPSALAAPMSVHHALTYSVRDSAVLLDIASPVMPGSAFCSLTQPTSFVEQMHADPGRLRIGLITKRADGGDVAAEVVGAAQAAAALCEELGHHVEETRFPHNHEQLVSAFGNLRGAGLLYQVDRHLTELGRDLHDDDLEPFTRLSLNHYRSTLAAVDVPRALSDVQEIAWCLGRMFTEYDILLMPTLAQPVPKLGMLDTTRPERLHALAGTYSAFTNVFNVTGQPAMSVPFGRDNEGLPVGVQLAADLGREGLLLALAARIEDARPWRNVTRSWR